LNGISAVVDGPLDVGRYIRGISAGVWWPKFGGGGTMVAFLRSHNGPL